MIKYYYAIIFSCFITFCEGQETLQSYMKSALDFYKAKNYKLYLFNLEKADSIRPNHQIIMYNLAGAYALNNKEKQAIEYLRKALIIKADFPIETDIDFKKLEKNKSFNDLLDLKKQLMTQKTGSKLAIEIRDKDLHIESIVYHEKQSAFYLGSIRKRKIVKIDKSGVVSDFKISKEDGLMAVMGMKIDQPRNLLWVTTVATKEMIDYDKNSLLKTGVLKYCLNTGNLLNSFWIESKDKHWFGDLAIDQKGDAYVTDSQSNKIYVVKNDKLNIFLSEERFQNLQGITFVNEFLFVSDYRKTIYKIDTYQQKVTELINPYQHLSLKGIDGLYTYKNSLIAISNGTTPNKVMQLKLNKKCNTIKSYNIIDNNHPMFGEPTLGEVYKDSFFYVANSQWSKYDKDGNINFDVLEPIRILKYDFTN